MSSQNPTLLFFFFCFFFCFFFLQCSPSSSPIKTVVVLVMENRSFDHMLGWMKKHNADINGVDGSESNPINTTDPSSPLIFFSQNNSSFTFLDPPHSFPSIQSQLFPPSPLPPMKGFAQQACSLDCTHLPAQVMSGFDPLLLPVYSSLLSHFSLFDRWFSSVPSSTQPNRLFLHSATSLGSTSNDPSLLALGFPQPTIFDHLHQNNLSFAIYYQNIPATLFFKSLRRLRFLTSNFWAYASYFKKHASEGRLPQYVVVEQRYMGYGSSSPANDDHPSHDVGEGQRLVKEVYEVLRSSPQWNHTLFIITYDEHGGFFDHVPTPVVGVPSPDDVVGPPPSRFRFDRLGVRVPTIMVSPWIEKGTVVHGPNGSPFATSEYEHSSIPATVKKIFNLSSPFLTRRDAWAGTFEGILNTRKEPRTDCPVKLPDPIKLGEEVKGEKEVSEFQGELIDLARVLKGDHLLREYGDEKVVKKKMTIKEGKEYVEDAVRRYFEAGKLAMRMGADPDRVLQMRSSLSTPPNHSTP